MYGQRQRFYIVVMTILVLAMISGDTLYAADANKLYGIHWWGHSQGVGVDTTPKSLLDLPTYSAWDTETVLTHSDYWWSPGYFTDLYSTLYSWNVSLITRVDYTWNDTIPAPSDPNYSSWPSVVVNNVVNVLKDKSHIWIVGNEPNILCAEGSLWPDRKIQPADYAAVYRNVRNAIHQSAAVGPPGQHIVLLAGPSYGPAEGVRWMSGATYLAQTLDNLSPSEVDGFALHAYGWNLAEFQDQYRTQLRIIDQKGFGNKPIWITEFGRYTIDDNDEQNSAQFVRDAFSDVNAWNQTAGNRDIIGMTWFVYDCNQQAGGGWNNWAIEYWKDHGFPSGDSRDLFTAFQQAVDQRYSAGTWGNLEFVVDNTAASYSGTWYTGTSATDKYLSDYKYASTAGSETAYAIWRPNISSAGYYDVYAWYSQGSNRSAVAPYTVYWNGGSQTVQVNQQTNGGRWNVLVASKPFATGTNGYAKLGNGTGESGKVVIADAVRFMCVQPMDTQPPSVPQNLTAVAASTSQINLSWSASTDNVGVAGYKVYRNGTYLTSVGQTNYSDTGLSMGVTYTYAVSAYDAAGNESSQSTPKDETTYIIVDNSDAGFSASANWSTGTMATDKYGINYRFRQTQATSDPATWAFNIPTADSYQVYAWWSAGTNRSTSAPYVVYYNGGSQTVTVNQQTNGGVFNSLGTFSLAAGSNQVKLSCWTTTGYVVIADAVRLIRR